MISIKKSQVAVMNIQYKYFPFKKFLQDAAENQVKNIELWGAAPHFHLDDLTYLEVKKIRHEIESYGLKLICYTPEQCVYPINIAASSRNERYRSLKFFEDNIRAASELGTDKVLVTSGWGYFDQSNYKEAWQYSEEGLYNLAEIAKANGIILALEVLRKDESNLVNDLPSLAKMLKKLNHNHIAGVLDTIPMALAGESPRDYLEALGDKLIHTHFVDGAPRGHLAWGDGILNMERYLEQFSHYDYMGVISLEITDGRYFTNPTVSVKQSIEKLYNVLI